MPRRTLRGLRKSVAGVDRTVHPKIESKSRWRKLHGLRNKVLLIACSGFVARRFTLTGFWRWKFVRAKSFAGNDGFERLCHFRKHTDCGFKNPKQFQQFLTHFPCPALRADLVKRRRRTASTPFHAVVQPRVDDLQSG